VDTILAFSSPKKAKDFGRRISRKVTSVSTTQSLLKKVNLGKEEPSIILVDLAMPSMKGIDIQKEIAKHVGNIPILLLSDLATAGSNRMLLSLVNNIHEEISNTLNHRNNLNTKKLLPKLHNSKSGRIDAKLIADFFQLSVAKVAKIVGSESKTVHKTPDAVRIQSGLSVFLRVASALMDNYGSKDKAKIWLNTPNPDLDNLQPLEVIKKGQCEVIAELLEDALLGHPG